MYCCTVMHSSVPATRSFVHPATYVQIFSGSPPPPILFNGIVLNFFSLKVSGLQYTDMNTVTSKLVDIVAVRQ